MPNDPKKDITPLGYQNYRGNHEQKFGIKLDDRRRHVYVVGKTGVGKSTLLENMAIADIAAGKGIAFIDPHGESAEKLLDFIPEERLDDVIYFDPSDMEHPMAFNPMEQVGTEFRHLVASGIMGVFKKIWVDAWSARMEYILNNTLLALLEYPGSTLLGVLRMFSEPPYRKKIVDNLKDPVIKAFWQNEFARYSQKLETEALAAIQNKVGQFVSNPLIRNILGQSRSTINMREIMDTGKIFIANLSKGKMGEDNSALLGAMVITRLQLAAMSRVDLPEDKRRDFYLYVDEFQNFATESFANILSEARKYRLSLVLAHQYIGQLIGKEGNTKVRDAVFGNVGTIITFRIGAADAEFLEPEFMPEFLQQDLVNLSKANVYLKLMIDGVASRPFSATTLPPPRQPLVSHRDVIISNSQQKYGVKRSIVEERIASEWGMQSDTAIDDKIGRRSERPISEVLRADNRPRQDSRGPRPVAARPPLQSPQFNNAPPRQYQQYQQPSRPVTPPASRPAAERVPEQSENQTQPQAQPQEQPRAQMQMPSRPQVQAEPQSPIVEVRQPAAPERRMADRRTPQEDRPLEQPVRRSAPPENHDKQTPAVSTPAQEESGMTPVEAAAVAKPAAPKPAPKHVPKANVDIDALRRAISESLARNQEEKEKNGPAGKS